MHKSHKIAKIYSGFTLAFFALLCGHPILGFHSCTFVIIRGQKSHSYFIFVHLVHPWQNAYLSLNEFVTTVTELIAMAAAATMGLNTPAMARGIAATL